MDHGPMICRSVLKLEQLRFDAGILNTAVLTNCVTAATADFLALGLSV